MSPWHRALSRSARRDVREALRKHRQRQTKSAELWTPQPQTARTRKTRKIKVHTGGGGDDAPKEGPKEAPKEGPKEAPKDPERERKALEAATNSVKANTAKAMKRARENLGAEKMLDPNVQQAIAERAASKGVDDGRGNPMRPLGAVQSAIRTGAKNAFQKLTEDGTMGAKALCSMRKAYTWLIFTVIVCMAWMRAMLVLNAGLRVHMEALKPKLDESSGSKEYVLLENRASRFVVFSVLFLTIMSTCLFVAILLVLCYSTLQIVDMLADNMPQQLWFVGDVIKWFTGVKTFFGAFEPEHFAVHGVVLTGTVVLAFFFAFMYLQEADLRHANRLRDKLMRATIALPFSAVLIYGLYFVLLVADCF
jgi:hypothetical protein